MTQWKGSFPINAANSALAAAKTSDDQCKIHSENKCRPVGVVKEGPHRAERFPNPFCLKAMNLNQRRNERTKSASFAQQDQPNRNSRFDQMVTKSDADSFSASHFQAGDKKINRHL
jgi:hypothetical protein